MVFNKKIFLICFFLFRGITNGYNQNLVLNGNFEDTLCCPNGFPTMQCANNCYDPTGVSSDFYHLCYPITIPSYILSSISGQGCGGLFNYYLYTDGSDYIEFKLSQKLVASHKYYLSFILRPNNLGLVADGLGVYFSQTKIDTPVNLFYLTPQIQNPSGNFYYDTTSWSTFYGEYTAIGDEEFITMGNFEIADSTLWDTIRNEMYDSRAYIFIDNVTLICKSR